LKLHLEQNALLHPDIYSGHAWSKELTVPGNRGVCGAMIFKGNAKLCVWGLHPIQQGNNLGQLCFKGGRRWDRPDRHLKMDLTNLG
jgi:hypothetical protein